MIEVLDTLPGIYLWMYVVLGGLFLLQSVSSGMRASPGLAGAVEGAGGLYLGSRRLSRALFGWMRTERGGRLLAILLGGSFALALGAHLFHFVTRWVINGHAPLQSKHEVFTVTGLTMMIFGLVLYLSERVWRLRGAEGALGNLIFVTITGLGGILWTALGMGESYKINNLVPALQSWWHPPHVSAYMLGYGSLGIAAILALLYCAGWSARVVPQGLAKGFSAVGLKGAGAFFGWAAAAGGAVERAVANPTVDRWTYKIVGLGFPFMTAALCMGALWADASWGEYWFWDAKETWALISWAFFVLYLHLRFVRGWAGIRTQLLALSGGLMILVTYLAMHLLPASHASLHVYN